MQDEIISIIEKATERSPVLLRDMIKELHFDKRAIEQVLKRLRKQDFVCFDKRAITIVEDRMPIDKDPHQRVRVVSCFHYWRKDD